MKPLTLLSSQGGCAAKTGPNELYKILDGISIDADIESHPFYKKKDAGHIQLLDNLYIVQSVDIVTPITDDPFTYGAIAVEHALSDLFAMMAKPICGLFVLGFPSLLISTQVANNILKGAIDRLSIHNCCLLKEHTISNKELFFGVCVTGILSNYKQNQIQEGDVLILTKPLGSGIISSALKLYNTETSIADYSHELVKASERIMLESNALASKIMTNWDIHACTDVTGFGLIGHLYELLIPNKHSAEISFNSIPLIPGVLDLARQGIVSTIGEKNLAYWGDYCKFSRTMSEAQKIAMFDAQTSGGLLIVISETQAESFLSALKSNGVSNSSIIGNITYSKESVPSITVTL